MYSKYLVMPNDNLYKIANRFQTTVKEIMDLNNLKSTVIYPNQILLIPNPQIQNEIVTNYNQTIHDLLDKYDLEIDDILDLKLIPDQVLNVKNKLFRITKDISLDEILNKHNITSEELIRLNQNRWLKAGNDIIIK